MDQRASGRAIIDMGWMFLALTAAVTVCDHESDSEIALLGAYALISSDILGCGW